VRTKLLLGLLINFGPSKVEFKRLLFWICVDPC